MSSVRGRRGPSGEGRRSSVRTPARTAHTGPVHTGRLGGRPAGASRPGARRSGRVPARSATAARRRPLFTGRAVVLGGLLLLLALTLAGPVRQFLAGQAELAHLAAEGRALEQRAEELEAQLARQQDPAWIEREARARLTYVQPGDRLIMVVDGRTVPVAGAQGADGAPTTPDLPWYEALLGSVAAADGDVAPEEPAAGQDGGADR